MIINQKKKKLFLSFAKDILRTKPESKIKKQGKKEITWRLSGHGVCGGK